jgi:hypothetical protein
LVSSGERDQLARDRDVPKKLTLGACGLSVRKSGRHHQRPPKREEAVNEVRIYLIDRGRPNREAEADSAEVVRLAVEALEKGREKE